jgi:hypothetical protein
MGEGVGWRDEVGGGVLRERGRLQRRVAYATRGCKWEVGAALGTGDPGLPTNWELATGDWKLPTGALLPDEQEDRGAEEDPVDGESGELVGTDVGEEPADDHEGGQRGHRAGEQDHGPGFVGF